MILISAPYSLCTGRVGAAAPEGWADPSLAPYPFLSELLCRAEDPGIQPYWLPR